MTAAGQGAQACEGTRRKRYPSVVSEILNEKSQPIRAGLVTSVWSSRREPIRSRRTFSIVLTRDESRSAVRSADGSSFAAQLRLHCFVMRIAGPGRQRKAGVGHTTLSARRMR